MNLALYEMADDYRRAMVAMEESAFDQQTIMDTLEGLAGDLETKAANIAAYCLNIEAEADAIAAAAEKLFAKSKTLDRRASWLREYLRVNMERCCLTVIAASDKTFSIKLKLNPEAVELDGSLPALPAEYLRTIPAKTEPDKVAIKDALKAGKEVPGARLVRKSRVEIK